MKSATVVGSGPNGLAAAITLARAGSRVLLIEGSPTIGGGARSAELTLPGFRHDVCSAVYPLAVGSPFFRSVPVAEYGLEWIHSPTVLAHPLDDGRAVLLHRSLDQTAASLGPDGDAYRDLMSPVVSTWDRLEQDLLGPMRMPRHPVALARFGLVGLQSASRLARNRFQGEPARALFGGLAAHSLLALDRPATASFGIVLGALAHRVGWPIPRGGAQKITDVLGSILRDAGGEIEVGQVVTSLDELPTSEATLLDVSPRQFLDLAGRELRRGYRAALERFRYGSGVFKVDFALDSPIPWTVAECGQAATVHVGGSLSEIEAAEATVASGGIPERPFVLLAQPSLFDDSRAPAGRHIVWAYCHVPSGCTTDMSERIEQQIERFAPGFRNHVLARHTMGPAAFEAYNANYIGGNINGGALNLTQVFARPTYRLNPYATSIAGVFLCSASTPPGGGVHGMCGYNAARSVLHIGR